MHGNRVFFILKQKILDVQLYWEVADWYCLVKCFGCFILVDYKLVYCAISLDQNLWD